MKMKNGEISIFYMCEPGRLEWQSLCLASSIKAFCTDRVHLVAYCSRHKYHALREETLTFHRKHHIDVIPIDTERVFEGIYHVGGKIVASCQNRSTEYSVLMDTDMLLINNVSFLEEGRPGKVAVFPSNTKALGYSREDWKYVYGIFDMPVPSARFRFDQLGGSILCEPYFNAGLIVFPEYPKALNGSAFGDCWLRTTQVLQKDNSVPSKNPWLDQIALPVAISRANFTYKPLDRVFNFPVEEQEKKIRDDVKVIHYHFGMNLHTCSARNLADGLIQEFAGYKSLSDLFRQYGNIGFASYDVQAR